MRSNFDPVSGVTAAMRIAAVALSLTLLGPAAADAARVERTTAPLYDIRGNQTGEEAAIAYRAEGAGGSRIVLRAVGAEVEVSDTAGLEAGRGCRRVAAEVVRCGPAVRAEVDAGGGDDDVSASGVRFALLRGGDGNDRLAGGAAETILVGGPGADTFLDGPKTDAVSYAGEPGPVHADLEGDADDGAAGEGDRIAAGIEGLRGSDGSDVLIGDAGPNSIIGTERSDEATAPDRIAAGGGDDELSVTADDTVDAGAGNDDLHISGNVSVTARGLADGGPGDDEINGTIYPERVRGGPGRDDIATFGGADAIDADDGEADVVACSLGDAVHGAAKLDVLDWAQGCDRTIRSAPARVVVLRPERGRWVELGCPEDHRGGCRGRVRVTAGGRVRLDRRFAIRAGRVGVFAAAGRRPPRGARLRVDARDAEGRVVTLRGVP